MKYSKLIVLLAVLVFAACEEQLEQIGDPKNVIGSTETYTKIIYADYDSLIQLDSAYYIEGNRSSFGHHHNTKMLFLMRFFKFFENDSLVSVDSAKLRMINDYVIGDYPTTIPLNFYEFTQPWSADTLQSIKNIYPNGSRADAILNLTSGTPILQQDYTYEEPDTLNNSRAETDTLYIDVDTDLIMRWYEDPDWELKGLLLYPDFVDNVMMNFYPFGSTSVTGIQISYTRVNDEGEHESIVDSLFQISTDVTFFDGDYPESMDDSYYFLSTGRIQRTFINFDYEELPDRAIVLLGRVIIPVDFDNSFLSVARPLKAIQMIPLINDAEGNLIEASFLQRFYIEDINEEHNLWKLHDGFAGPFASEILQPLYNGIRNNPDSLFINGYYLDLWGSMDDYSFIKINSVKSPENDLKPRIEIVYFIPPKSRF